MVDGLASSRTNMAGDQGVGKARRSMPTTCGRSLKPMRRTAIRSTGFGIRRALVIRGETVQRGHRFPRRQLDVAPRRHPVKLGGILRNTYPGLVKDLPECYRAISDGQDA